MRPVAPRSSPAPNLAQPKQLLRRSVERRSIPSGQAAHRHPKERGHLGQRHEFAKSLEDRHPVHVPEPTPTGRARLSPARHHP